MSLLKKITNGIFKLFILPFKYKKGDDYNAEQYWQDRFAKYGSSLRAVGHESLSESKNAELYENAVKIIKNELDHIIDSKDSSSLIEIGVGRGVFTDIIYNSFEVDYLGLDITDFYFEELQSKYKEFEFVKKDITEKLDLPESDIVLFIDVIEHIVKKDKLLRCLQNIENTLKNDGYLFISGYTHESSSKKLFYVKSWNLEDIIESTDTLELVKEMPFRNNHLAVFKKSS